MHWVQSDAQKSFEVPAIILGEGHIAPDFSAANFVCTQILVPIIVGSNLLLVSNCFELSGHREREADAIQQDQPHIRNTNISFTARNDRLVIKDNVLMQSPESVIITFYGPAF